MISVTPNKLPDWDLQKAYMLSRLLLESRAPDSLVQKYFLFLRNHSKFMLSMFPFFSFQHLPMCPLTSSPLCLGHLVTTGKFCGILVITYSFDQRYKSGSACQHYLLRAIASSTTLACCLGLHFRNLDLPLPTVPLVTVDWTKHWHLRHSKQIHWLTSNRWHHNLALQMSWARFLFLKILIEKHRDTELVSR